MRFGFTEDQLAFRDAVRDLLADACPPRAVRAAWQGGPGYDRELWSRLGEMGVLAVLGPADCGGLGLTEIELVLLLEETGRAALPGPVVEHAAVAVPLLAGAGETDLAWRAASGEAVVSVAESASRVGWGASADAIVLLDGPRLVAGEEVVAVEPLASVDRSRRDARVELDAGAGTPLATDAALARDRAALGTAAQLCGLAARLIEMTVEYAGERRQFGVPIGSFQAVKHHLADALLRLEHARPPVYAAAWSVACDLPTRSRDVSMAKALSGRAAALAGRVALQCHGAIGYTWEHDLHLWMKRVWVLERRWGDTAAHRRTVADAVLGRPPDRPVALSRPIG
jgi:alkylation response protein AidB-like acyl-CoA dehydrogenase